MRRGQAEPKTNAKPPIQEAFINISSTSISTREGGERGTQGRGQAAQTGNPLRNRGDAEKAVANAEQVQLSRHSAGFPATLLPVPAETGKGMGLPLLGDGGGGQWHLHGISKHR